MVQENFDFVDGGGGGSDGFRPSEAQIVYDMDGNPWRVVYEGSNRQWTALTNGERMLNTGMFYTSTGQLFELQNANIVGNRSLTQSERAALGIGGGSGGSGGGGGGGGSGSTALQELRERIAAENASREDEQAFEREMSAIDRRQRNRLERLSRENAVRLQRIQNINSLAGEFAQMQQQARQLIAETLGKDPVRGAIMMAGGLQRGTTPNQQFQTDLTSFANQSMPFGLKAANTRPNIPLDMLGRIEGRFRNRVMAGIPQAPLYGLAEGGVIDPGMGGTVTPSMMNRRGVLVGEGENGEGIAAGTAEVLALGPDGSVEVIPLAATAQTGISPNQVTSIRQSLSPFFGEMGFDRMPTAARSPGYLPTLRFEGSHPLYATSMMQRLGIRPRLIQIGNDPNNFFYADQEGNLSAIAPEVAFGAGGFRPHDAVRLQAPSDFSQLGQQTAPLGLRFTGQRMTSLPSLMETGGRTTRPSAVTATPIYDEATGIVLPDPAQAAATFRGMDPMLQEMLLQTYERAGIDRLSVAADLDFYSPRGTGGGLTGLG